MADYGDAYAWDQEGVCIGLPYNFPEREIIAQIEKELEEWAGWFMLNDKDLNFPWNAFHEKGLALAKRVSCKEGIKSDSRRTDSVFFKKTKREHHVEKT